MRPQIEGCCAPQNSSRDEFQLVVMMQAAETCAGNDAMSGWQAMSGQCRLAGWVVGKSRTQRGMWSFTVVMGHPLRQHRPNMLFIERNQPIETLAPDRPNEAFTVRVRLRGTYQCFQHV